MSNEHPRSSRLKSMLAWAVVILVVIGATGGRWWIQRPKTSAEQFIALLGDRQFDEARELLKDSDALRIAANGAITFTAADQTSVTLVADQSRMIAGGGDEPSARGIGDYLSGTYPFSCAAFQGGGEGDPEHISVIEARATALGIVIDSIEP